MANKLIITLGSQYGLPECITKNHDPGFHGHFWDELISLLNTILIFSTASYLQTDRIDMVTNYSIENFLCLYAKQERVCAKTTLSRHAYLCNTLVMY